MAESSGQRTKRCRDCGVVKPVSEFWRRKQSPDGWALYCKECFGLRNAASYRGQLAVQGKKARPYRRYSAVPPGMKYCANCGETKLISEFGRNRANKSGLAYYCKPCHNRVMAEIKQKNHGSVRSYHLKRRYGLTEQEVAGHEGRQLGRCLICQGEATLHVDHDHTNGNFRGLLCFNCNNGLGQFKDDPVLLRRAADYLDDELWDEPGAWVVDLSGQDGAQRPARSHPVGRELRRHYKLTARYGLGLDEVERMIEEQGGVCPICRSAEPRDVDHDHDTGEVRGILCPSCNTGMGQFKDNAGYLRHAAAYLEGTAARDPDLAARAVFVVDLPPHAAARAASRAEARLAELLAESGAN